MPMLLIKGSFHLSGRTSPDGDTLPFVPDYVGEWKLVGGCERVKPTREGRASVRLEGVDALETHYDGPYGEVERQPRELGDAATNSLLEWLGFRDIRRVPDPDHPGSENISATPDRVPGYILTRGTDIYGRCVALVGRGVPPGASGYEFDVREKLLRETANHHMLAEGLAYPMFYGGLPWDLRKELTAAVLQAKTAPGKGVWQRDANGETVDVTLRGAKVVDMTSITQGAVILPKLFRRLKEYLSLGYPNLDGFPAYLGGSMDRFRILGPNPSPGELVGLQNVVRVLNGGTVLMTHASEDLLFIEK
ncbi:thermonuclease family protein [Streptomyces sp. NPDC101115]|uniref:thermonuclease family protein n=1 Tax=Streptomyces sp. NPDC101115 TaxID=3366106 RepID=UPI00382512F0